MARADHVGFFWDDTPPPPPPKMEKVKRTPPEPVWLLPTYLPNLQEAQSMELQEFHDMELLHAAREGERLVFDIECYSNYFLAAFKGMKSGKFLAFELSDLWMGTEGLDCAKLRWVLENFCIVTFNGNGYDMPIISLALAGWSCAQLKEASDKLIVKDMLGNTVQPHVILKSAKVKRIVANHIDLIEVAPGQASLKKYAGRMHTRRMQDLPFHPNAQLSREQALIVRWYCVNDLVNTQMLHDKLKEQLELRESMSKEYDQDLRSKSDAQVAEAVIAEEVSRLNGVKAQRPSIPVGTVYRYKAPTFLQYQTPLMRGVLQTVCNAPFIVDESGSIGLPPELKDLKIQIADSLYRMGIGGLHSSEKSAAHVADGDIVLEDRDVTSYYPYIILNLGLYPHHLGPNFLSVYRSLVERRLQAKRSGNKVVADSLKITINGSFGKLGSKYSVLYSPDLLIQVTVTGQLSLLMLIEWLELAGIHVVSANTDGIVLKYRKHQTDLKNQIVKYWETVTGFETEATLYRALYSRDVNNYLAIYAEPAKNKDGSFTYAKTKGVFAKEGLQKDAKSQICVDAAIDWLIHKTQISTTIRDCKRLEKFVAMQFVNGGAVKVYDEQRTEYLGKAVRWYYAKDVQGEIVYAKNGNKVPRTDGAQPVMLLPETFPQDIDYEWYERETEAILKGIGYE